MILSSKICIVGWILLGLGWLGQINSWYSDSYSMIPLTLFSVAGTMFFMNIFIIRLEITNGDKLQ